MTKPPVLIAVAPMMDCTDRHYRYFVRLMTRHTLLYTEMIHCNQLLLGDQARFLEFHPQEQPLAIQLGGSDPKALAQAAKLAQNYGYQEINLNVGCPSDRVQAGQFGACLMKDAATVAYSILAMQDAVDLPVTVKTRIGVDNHDSYRFLTEFIGQVQKAGCTKFIIHARKAWLKGLSPRQNRTVPPLNYERVYQLKRDFPELTIIINGGITSSTAIAEHLRQVDGVMIGREVYHHPYFATKFDQFFPFTPLPPIKTRLQIFKEFLPYVEQELRKGTKLSLLIRPILGLFHGIPGVKTWRQYLINNAQAQNGVEILERSIIDLFQIPSLTSLSPLYGGEMERGLARVGGNKLFPLKEY